MRQALIFDDVYDDENEEDTALLAYSDGEGNVILEPWPNGSNNVQVILSLEELTALKRLL